MQLESEMDGSALIFGQAGERLLSAKSNVSYPLVDRVPDLSAKDRYQPFSITSGRSPNDSCCKIAIEF
jgi:hypothetical protein